MSKQHFKREKRKRINVLLECINSCEKRKMKIRLLDILACPIDKKWPLKVHIFEKKTIELEQIPPKDEETGVVCRHYCGRKGIHLEKDKQPEEQKKQISYEKDCSECFSEIVVAGMIECPECGTFYPIIEEIPVMLRAELRNEQVEREFIDQWAEKIKELHENKKK
jgi:uncharacterized protein YbaR (Trm112 family)